MTRAEDRILPAHAGSRTVYAFVVAAGAVTLLAAGLVSVTGESPILDPGTVFLGPYLPAATVIFAAAFLIVERMGFLFYWRRHQVSLNLDEVALFVGFVFLPLPHVVLGVALGALGNQILTRRPLVKGVFNTALYTLGGGLSALGVGALRAAGFAVPWPSVAAPAIFIITTLGLLSLHLARIERTSAIRVFTERFGPWSIAGAAIGASFGLILYALFVFHPAAPLLALPTGYYLHRFGRLSEWADKELRAHQRLAEVSRAVAGSSDLDIVADRVLEACGDLFACGEARLTLAVREGDPPRVWDRAFADGAARTGGITAIVRGSSGERIGELTVFPQREQRPYGERESNLLYTVATSAEAAAANARALRVTEEAVRSVTASERRYRALFDTANVFIHVLDAHGRVVDVNPAALEGLGHDVDLAHPQSFTEFFPPDERGTAREALDALLSGKAVRRECRLGSRDGELVHVLLDARSLNLPEDAQHPGRYVVVSRDVTSLKRLEGDLRGALAEREETIRRLENLNRELEEFTLWVTHDMREPLRGVSTVAQFLWDDVDDLSQEEVREHAQRIRDAAERLKERVKALHAFSRIVQRDEAFRDVDMQDVLDGVLQGLESKIRETGTLVRTPETPLPIVRAQPHRIDLVFSNLIENAIKYADSEQAIIEVGVEEREDEYCFFVRDNGPGIPQEYHDRIFQLFQRGPGSLSRPGPGAGLAIVKRITEQHGGRTWVESVEGEGAVFWFTLVRGTSPEATAASGAAKTLTAGKRAT